MPILVSCLLRASSEISKRQHIDTTDGPVDLFTHVAWPPFLRMFSLNSFLIPIHYAINPPTVPSYELLLKRDLVLRVHYSKEVHQHDHGHYLEGSQELAFLMSSWYI